MDRPPDKSGKKRIVVLGGGFGGVYAAIHLEKLLARESAVEICLVSHNNFFLFTPMLHEIAASDLEITNIVNPLRKLLRKAEVLVGDVNQIDLPNRRVFISCGYRNHPLQIDYDHLVIALGSVTNFYDIPGLADLAIPMKSLRDAIQLRAQIIRRLEEANSECNLADRQSLLTFIVAGGGFAGVETVAALNDFVREALPFYPNLSEDMLRVMLVHSGPVILPELGESLGQHTQKVLAGRGVEIRLNTRVKSMTEDQVFLAYRIPIPCSTLVWTAGTVPSPSIFSLPCAKERGRIRVNHFLQVPDWPDVWAVGDCAFVPDIRNPGESYRGCTLRSSSKIILIQDDWVAGVYRSADGRGADFRFQFFRLLRLVDVADDLPQQVTRFGQKGPCGIRLDIGSSLSQGRLRSVRPR